ncbi:predicted protein [Micromonas commoda]|uniref:Glucosidase 2 subunit beta n=1 Tax=Micromonas commoda (strain RCC299 / NOUM17 / CCMP2709) TaxID=296587 RepID=C1EJ26_MICCC|nr:predicted protein [Micromonas commoda]ACO67963.1 predicted protein [Micromonas commoda]|eukprot:XP_002506705.1 predicted protein [Micromonas commoda]
MRTTRGALRILTAALLVAAVRCGSIDAGSRVLPRGANPADAERYAAHDGSSAFVCDGGATTIDRSRVNDDYCDCDDGADEPGTSACANGEFHCRNRGHRSISLPSSRVNDGVCDCCDGTDEHDGGARCPNTCLAAGASRRDEIRARVSSARGGVDARRKILEGAPALRRRWQDESVKLEKDVAAQREIVRDASVAKEAAEAEEKKATEAEDRLNKREASKNKGDDDASGNETAVADTAVADAVPTPTPTSTETVDEYPVIEDDAVPELQAIDDVADEREESEEERGRRIAQQWIHGDSESTGTAPSGPSSPADVPDAIRDRATRAKKAANDKRDVHAQAQRTLTELEGKHKDVTKRLSTFFGPNMELAHMVGECYKLTVEQYAYEVCPFGDAKQDTTRLGTMQPVDVKDPRTMVFNGGERCWNGPARSITVSLRCGGGGNKLADVEEPSRCEYAAKLYTPAACDPGEVDALERELAEMEEEARAAMGAPHDEL